MALGWQEWFMRLAVGYTAVPSWTSDTVCTLSEPEAPSSCTVEMVWVLQRNWSKWWRNRFLSWVRVRPGRHIVWLSSKFVGSLASAKSEGTIGVISVLSSTLSLFFKCWRITSPKHSVNLSAIWRRWEIVIINFPTSACINCFLTFSIKIFWEVSENLSSCATREQMEL